jgi:hypothetical protein
MSKDSSYPKEKAENVLCEVLQGTNKKGWIVELKFSEIKTKDYADMLYKLCKSFYKHYTNEIPSSPTTKIGEVKTEE